MSQAWHHHAPPVGWQGQWPPPPGMQMPPGFPGPPPVPQGVPVPPQAWQSGFWQFNPASRNPGVNPGLQVGSSSRPIPPPVAGPGPWAPSNHWGRPIPPPAQPQQPQQQPQQQPGEGFNPYKKIPKPPEAGYYDYKLVDNPLGLEGMVPRKEPVEGEEAKTPWIWNPATLRETDDRPLKAASFPHSRSSLDGGSKSVSHHQALYQQQLQQQRSQSTTSASASAGQIPRRSASVDLRSHNPGVIAPSLGYYGIGPNDQPDVTRHRPLNQNPVFPDTATSMMPAGFVPNHTAASTPIPPPGPTSMYPPPRSQTQPPPGSTQGQQHLRKSESFTERKELHPTFSPQIVRTPDHYHRKNIEATRQLQNGRSSTGNGGSGIYRPSTSAPLSSSYAPRTQSAIDEMNGRSSSVNRNDDGRQAQPLERHSSLPASLMSSASLATSSSVTIGLSSFTDEPTSLLSPLIGATPKAGAGPLAPNQLLSRSKTLTTIPESSNPSPRVSPRERERDREREREREWDRERDRDRDRDRGGTSVPMAITDGTPSRSRHNGTPHPRRENPLPAPPADIQRDVPISPQRPAPASYSRKIRKGLWNKRGDHLTSDMHVVYAPADRAYPPELEKYPDGQQGYWDAVINQHVPWLEDRPELPSSLPYRGRPPTQPYDTFVVYTYIP